MSCLKSRLTVREVVHGKCCVSCLKGVGSEMVRMTREGHEFADRLRVVREEYEFGEAA